jgi:hypothetical protein
MFKSTILSLLLFIGVGLFAQSTTDREEKIRSLRVAFITDKLKLTPEESQAFWPIYNELESKKKQLGIHGRGEQSFDLLNDNEIEKWLDDRLVAEQTMLDLKKEFIAKLKTILPIRKVAKLHQTEMEFRKTLLHMTREKTGERRGHGGR